jgi:IS1 family transposase
MGVNGRGIRDTTRVLRISPTTVIEELKKDRYLEQVNQPLVEHMGNAIEPVMVLKVDEAEMDEMWNFVKPKQQQRWLWSAIDHRIGKMLVYVLAPHQDTALVKLKALLQPFGLTHFYTGWRADLRLLESQQHTVSKANTQKIER